LLAGEQNKKQNFSFLAVWSISKMVLSGNLKQPLDIFEYDSE